MTMLTTSTTGSTKLKVGPDWRLRAACRGPQSAMFFPPGHFERKDDKRERERRAKSICSTCSVVGDCREYSLTIREQHGIWGGLNEKERREVLDN